MIRRFLIWRARKRMEQPRYRIDRRRYRPGITPGLFAHLDASRFWGTETDPFYRRKRRNSRIRWTIVALLLPIMAWVAYESVRALQWF